MNNNVWRPDLGEPNTLWFKVDDSMSHWIEDGLKAQATQLYHAIQEHMDLCGIESATVCNVRTRNLVATYGSLEEAAKHERIIHNCLQDLAFLHTELGKINSILFQIHELRLDSSKQGNDPELTDWTPRDKLKEIQATVNYRQEVAKDDTGYLPAIKDDEVDTDARPGAGKSILHLTDDLPDVNGVPVSKPPGKLPPGKTGDGTTVAVTLEKDPPEDVRHQ